MKKLWNNPEFNELGVKFTEEQFGSITIAEDENGKNAKAYTEADAANAVQETRIFVPVWYFYDICANKWVSTGKNSLCEAIIFAFDYMRTNYPNGCPVS